MTKTQPSDPIQVRTYTGASPAEAARRFEDDAREAAQRGYRPSSQTWSGSSLTVTYQVEQQGAGMGTMPLEPLAIGIGGLMGAIGSALPWVTAGAGAFSASRSGIQGSDGLITVVLGIGLILLGVAGLRDRDEPRWTVSLILAVVMGGLAAFHIYEIQERASVSTELGISFQAEVGIGLWIIAVGALVAGSAAWRQRGESRASMA